MGVKIQCPPQDALRRLLLGKLAPAELDSMGAHVLKCERCAAVLNELRASDDLMEALRGAETAIVPDTKVQSLIDRISRPSRPESSATQAGTPAPSAAKDNVIRSWASGQELSEHGLPPAAEGSDELDRLGGYKVLKQLGQGGMGAVYLAEDVQLERLVALKVMRPELAANPDARRRFLREARATAQLKDDHVVAIYQVSEHKGMPFLAMEYLRGESLEQWLGRGKSLTSGQILRIARDIARGLAAAHAKGLIHRDIKPANLWLESPQGRVKVLDFGLARGDKDDMHLTQTGTILGTPAYMSPEQSRGEPADARSDLFSLGCILYRLCTGQLPFSGPTMMSTLTALATKNPVPVTELNPKIPSELAELTMQLLAKPREERPQSAQTVLQEIQAIASHSRTGSRGATEKEVDAKLFAFHQDTEKLVSIKAEATGHARAASAPPHRSIPLKWVVAGGLALICVFVAAQIVIRIGHKDGSETKIEVPKDSTVIVEDKGKVVAKVPSETAKAKPAVVVDPHRRLAEMVLNHEGTVTVLTAKAGVDVAAMKDLPKKPFLVSNIKLLSKPIPDQALEAFAGVHEIGVLHVTLAGESGLRHLREVAFEEIVLNGEKLDGDLCLELLGDHRPNLRKLTITCSTLSDAAVPHLLRMKHLHNLGLFGCSKLTDAGIKALASHPELEFVWIDPITPQAAAHFSQLPYLKQVNLSNVDDSAVPFLSRLTTANAIHPIGNLSADAAHRLQKAMPNTAILHPAIPPSDAERAAVRWALDNKVVMAGSLNWADPVKEIPTTTFCLGPLTFPNDVVRTGASHLRGLRSVYALRWFGFNNLDDEAEHLATLDSVCSMWFGKTTVSAKGMERLTALKKLESLSFLQVPSMSTEVLSYVPKFKHLSGFGVNGSPVTDSGLAEIAKAEGLQNLVLEWCGGPFTGAGLKHLASLPLLRYLKLSGTPLDATAVGSLKLLTSLRILEVQQTQLVADDIMALHKALPKCAIFWDGGLVMPGTEGEREVKQP